jgi:hypothetical protein
MSAPQCDQPATPAGAAPIPMSLRAIAAWLESHRLARPDTVDLLRWAYNPPTVIVREYLSGDQSGLYDRAREIGEGWHDEWRDRALGVEWQIAPGVVYRLRDTR